MSPTVLETDRLILRPLGAEDADDLVALDADPEVMRYITDGQPVTPEAVLAGLARRLAGADAEGWHGFLAALDRATGEWLGWFHLVQDPDRPGTWDLGYRLKRSAWGRGLATEGSVELVRYAFEVRGAQRVTARTMLANRASRRVLEKAGLQWVGQYIEDRFPGPDRRAVRYALDRADGPAQEPAPRRPHLPG